MGSRNMQYGFQIEMWILKINSAIPHGAMFWSSNSYPATELDTLVPVIVQLSYEKWHAVIVSC